MSERRIDALARALADGTSRRRALRTLAGGALAGIGGLAAAGSRIAAGCVRVRGRCKSDAECCAGSCVFTRGVGRCLCPPDQRRCGAAACCPSGWLCESGACRDPNVCADGSPPCRGRCWPPCGFDAPRDERCNCLCPPGTDLCGRVCINVVDDPANCGECRHACAPGEICAEGACGQPCTDNFDCPDPPEVCTFGTCPFGACFVLAVECFPGFTCCKTADDIVCVEGECPATGG